MKKINNYVLLEKQLIYIANKLINSKYFKFNNKYIKNISNYSIEIIKEKNILNCKIYKKNNKNILFYKKIYENK